MTPTTGYATKEELYAVKQDLSKRIGDVELHLSLKMGDMQTHIDARFNDVDTRFSDVDARFDEMRDEMRRMEQNNLTLFAALFAHLGIDTPSLH